MVLRAYCCKRLRIAAPDLSTTRVVLCTKFSALCGKAWDEERSTKCDGAPYFAPAEGSLRRGSWTDAIGQKRS